MADQAKGKGIAPKRASNLADPGQSSRPPPPIRTLSEDKEDGEDYSEVIEVLKQHIKSHERDSVSAIKNISSTLASLTNSSNTAAATIGKTSYSPRFDPFSSTIDLDSPLRPPRKEPHLGPAINLATSNLDPPIDTGSKEGFKDTITSSIVKELSKKAYTIPDNRISNFLENPDISNTYSDSDQAVLFILLYNSLSSSPRAAISRPIESKKKDVYNEFHALTFSTYKKGLSAFNAEFNGYLAKLTIAKIDIDPSLILNYLNIEYLIANILEESRNLATEAYRAAHIANSSNSTPNSNSNPSKKGKNKKKGKKKASYNAERQNYSAKSAEQASFILGSYNLAKEEEEEESNSSSNSRYTKRKDFKGKGLKTSSNNKAKYKDNKPRRRPRDPALYNSWLYDTGSTDHISNSKERFTTFTPNTGQLRPINTGNSPISPASIGSITLEVLSRKAPPTYTKLVLDDVLYLPNININIVSGVRHYDSGGCLIKETLYRGNRRCIAVLDFKKSGFFLNVKGSSKPILHTNFAFPLGLSSYTTKSIEPEPEPLTGTRDLPHVLREPVIEGNKVVEKAISSSTLKEPNIGQRDYYNLLNLAKLWHVRLGHIGLCLLKKTSSITKGLPNFDKIKEADFHCSSCNRGKAVRRVSKALIPDPPRVLDLIEDDTVKIRPRPYNRNPIVLLLVNRKSRYRWVFNLPNKSGPIVANAIKGFFRGLRNGFGRYPTKFHFDGGTEITDLLTTWLAKRGIKFSTSAPYIHEQNGLVERSPTDNTALEGELVDLDLDLEGAVSPDPSNLNTEKPISIEIGPSKLESYESSSESELDEPSPDKPINPVIPITNEPLDNSDLISEGDKMQLDYYKLLAKTSSYILSFVYKARKRVISKDSTPTTYKQVLKLPRDKRSKWLEAITKEFIQLLELGVFKFLPRSLLPSNYLGVFYNAKTCHFIVTYVDDCLFIGPNIGYITDLKKQLNKVYAIEDLGPATYFLGLSRSLNRPTKSHLNAAKNLFKYLNSTKDYSICFSCNGNTVADLGPKLSNSSNTTTKLSRDFHSKEGPRPLTTTSTTIVDSRNSKGSSQTSIINSSLVPIGFSDSDFAGDKATSKSTYGYLYKLAGRPISWKTKRATTIALSTLEAETNGLTEAIREVQTKHTLLKFRYVREQVKAKIVTIIYLNTKY
ncbi:hypothetical protein P8C59_008057 [Phyllachora maydis]|uniref:Integrase catalytic domain-containing protein n=1 Tax=Phyllachora maydis TaxID=1825666 RepID=A0AAD9I9U1_9PEZI|nr:hypothetical protein P8C59_008057 [Phyllachora maydis]